MFDILIRFRCHRYVWSADVTKMYRQILINPSQRKLQRIIWRDDPNHALGTYELQTVTYGTSSASYLAIRCLIQLADENREQFLLGSSIIKQDFYVDDLLTGSFTVEEAIQIRNEANMILSQGKFELRQWCSNDKKILEGLDKNDELAVIDFNKEESVKTLGLHWNCSNDELLYSVSKEIVTKRITKKIILSEISKIFDPLGLIGPITIKGKILMQRLWSLNLKWEDVVPDNIQKDWEEIREQIRLVSEVKISRMAASFDAYQTEYHGFCDASILAYGTCIYVKGIDKFDNVNVTLLCAKSKVAPLKAKSLPRLELCGALLLAQLMKKVLLAKNRDKLKVYYWSDSQITLAWIKVKHNWKAFVSNRIGEIHELSNPDQWRHVSGKDNPADIISRGATTTQLLNCSIWWKGPEFLKTNNKLDTELIVNDDLQQQIELEITASYHSSTYEWDIFDKYSNLLNLVRIVARCLRFINRIKLCRELVMHNYLTAKELDIANEILIKSIQQTAFSSELQELKERGSVGLGNNSRILCLNPFLDKENIIRVGERLRNSRLNYMARHQIFLPSNHKYVTLLIRKTHEDNHHIGAQGTLAIIRERYWPLKARSVIRNVLMKCITCFRSNPKETNQIMSDLPLDRVNLTRTFANCGVDFCGPFFIRMDKRRNAKTMKVYISLFVCLAVKAVHLEMVYGFNL